MVESQRAEILRLKGEVGFYNVEVADSKGSTDDEIQACQTVVNGFVHAEIEEDCLIIMPGDADETEYTNFLLAKQLLLLRTIKRILVFFAVLTGVSIGIWLIPFLISAMSSY